MNIKTFLLALGIILLTAGCGGSKPAPAPVVKKKPLPSWYLNPPKDDARYMYGVGSAEDRDAAIKAALVDMVSKLGVSIESSMESTQETLNNYYANSVSKSTIKAQVSKIRISNYEVVAAQRISYREFAVLIKSDKHALFAGLKKEVDGKLEQMKERLKLAKSMDRLSRYNLKKKLAQEAKELTANVYILAQLRPDFNDKPYLQEIQRIQEAFEKEKAQLAFGVFAKNKEASIFAEKITNYLTSKGLSVKRSPNSLKITVESSMNVVYSTFTIAVVKVKIKVFDGKNIVGSTDRVIKLRYNAQKESLLRRAAAELEKDLRNEGLQKVLGLKLDL